MDDHDDFWTVPSESREPTAANEPKAPPPPRPRRHYLAAGAGALLVGMLAAAGISFAATKSDTSSTTGANAAGANAAGTNGPPGAMGGAPGGRQGGPASVGTIASIDGDTLTITTADGSTVTVTTSSSTAVSEVTDASVSELTVGEQVAVTGSSGSDGTVSATNIRAGDVTNAGSGPPQPPN